MTSSTQKKTKKSADATTSYVTLTVRMPPALMSWIGSVKAEEGNDSVTETFQRCASGVRSYFNVSVLDAARLEKERMAMNEALRPGMERMSRMVYLQYVLSRYAQLLHTADREGKAATDLELIAGSVRDIRGVPPKTHGRKKEG